jgi:hypothetical protein
MTELIQVIHALDTWLKSKDILTKGVRIEITFPEHDDAVRALVAQYLEWEPFKSPYLVRTNIDHMGTSEIMGYKVRFAEYERPKW